MVLGVYAIIVMPRYTSDALHLTRASALANYLKKENVLGSYILHAMHWNARLGCEIFIGNGLRNDYKVWIFKSSIFLISCVAGAKRMVQMRFQYDCRTISECENSSDMNRLVDMVRRHFYIS